MGEAGNCRSQEVPGDAGGADHMSTGGDVESGSLHLAQVAVDPHTSAAC